ncbi:hypothetical protein ACLOJK_002949 [Asimina triloba]
MFRSLGSSSYAPFPSFSRSPFILFTGRSKTMFFCPSPLNPDWLEIQFNQSQGNENPTKKPIFHFVSMMLPNIILALFLIPISFFSISNLPRASAQIHTACDRSCRGRPVPYPFGFSDGCDIPLRCDAGEIKVRNFRVVNITSDSLLLDVPPKCDRRLGAGSVFFGPNFAPSWHNGLLLRNCTGNGTGCSISTSLLEERRLELQNCGAKVDGDIRCFSQGRSDGFWELERMTSFECDVLFTSVTVGNGSQKGSVEMEIGTVELGWWVEGRCGMNGSCSTHANCTDVVSPVNRKVRKPGFRCQCVEGYEGDGFVAGVGCRKGTISFLPLLTLSSAPNCVDALVEDVNDTRVLDINITNPSKFS